ncbi:MAG: hypothetical protein Q4B68_05010 [Bacteroidales bacterium]|nr:hypothetical protein [Bacteroidales bacterium]
MDNNNEKHLVEQEALPLPLHEMIAENARRNRALQKPYDPITGEGATGTRVRTVVPCVGEVWLPQEMLDHEDVGALTDEVAYQKVRIRYDFEFWCALCATVRHKVSGRNVKLHLNAPQRYVLAKMERQRLSGKGVRMILLKARQWGGSTLVLMYMAWIQLVLCKNWNSIICGHKRSNSSVIKGMYTKLLRNYPKALLPEGKRLEFQTFEGNANAKIITGRDCLVLMGSAQTDDVVRGYDIAMAHLSEVAFWPSSTMRNPEDVMRSIDGTLLVGGLTVEVLESTANGIGTYFHKEWLNSQKGITDKEAVFVPWHKIEIYRLPLDEGEKVEALWQRFDTYERNLWHSGCTLEMIKWYHEKRKGYLSHEKMMAEFPSNSIEAFSTTSSCVFPLARLDAMREQCCDPIAQGELKLLHGQWKVVKEGKPRFKVWKMPDEHLINGRYVVGVDVGGRTDKADYSVISVLECQGERCETVAQWRGHIDHDLLIDKAIDIASFYGYALLAVESNTLETNRADSRSALLMKQLNTYRNLYRRKVGSTMNVGYQTNKKTKPQLIDNIVRMVRDGRFVEHDSDAIDEMSWYEEKPGGTLGAIKGKHDDIVMSRAIALMANNSTSIIPDTTNFPKAQSETHPQSQSKDTTQLATQ